MTYHSILRTHERAGLGVDSAVRMIYNAKERGKRAKEFPARERRYMLGKERDGSYLKYYAGYCFVFNEEHACVTMFLAPDWFGKKAKYNGKDVVRNSKRYARCYPEKSYRRQYGVDYEKEAEAV